MTAKPHRSHEDATVESFARDPAYAAEYLNAVLEDGDRGELMLALRRLARAFGGVAAVAEEADLNVTTLYRTLSEQGNPELTTLMNVLAVMNLRLAVQPRAAEARAEESLYRVVSRSISPRVPQPSAGFFKIERVTPCAVANVPERFFARTAGAGVQL